MRRNIELEATIVTKYAAVSPVLDERSRRRWAAAESLAIGYGGDALVSSATGLARETIRKGRREIAQGEAPTDRLRRPGAGRPRIERRQPGLLSALEALVDPLTRGPAAQSAQGAVVVQTIEQHAGGNQCEDGLGDESAGQGCTVAGWTAATLVRVRQQRFHPYPFEHHDETLVAFPQHADGFLKLREQQRLKARPVTR